MNKYLIPIILFIAAFLFLLKLNNFEFNQNVVWKIEEQRREHSHLFPNAAIPLHNKISYATISILDNYLSPLSPLLFFLLLYFYFKKRS